MRVGVHYSEFLPSQSIMVTTLEEALCKLPEFKLQHTTTCDDARGTRRLDLISSAWGHVFPWFTRGRSLNRPCPLSQSCETSG